MASKAAAEEKKGVVIGLVIFVLLSLILAVTTYTGYNGQTMLLDEKKKADAEVETQKKIRSWEQFKALLFKAYAGHATGKTDLDDLATLRTAFEGGSLGQGEK